MLQVPGPHLSHSLPHRTISTSLVLYFPKKATSQPGPLLLQAAVCPLVEMESSGMMWLERSQGSVSYLPNPREDQLHPRKFGICLLSLLAGLQTPQVTYPSWRDTAIMLLVCPRFAQSVDLKGEIILFPTFCSQPTLVLLHEHTQPLAVLLSIFHICLPPWNSSVAWPSSDLSMSIYEWRKEMVAHVLLLFWITSDASL